MTTVAYTALPGAPHYIPPTMRLFHGSGPSGSGETLMQWAKPIQVHWRSSGQISTMDIEHVMGQGAGGKSRHYIEDRRTAVAAGDRIRLVDTTTGTERFRGYASQSMETIQSPPDEESSRWTVLGPERLLTGKVILGEWRKHEDTDDADFDATLTHAAAVRDTIFQTPYPCIFNVGGKPNASGMSWKLDSAAAHYAPSLANNDCLVFEPWGRKLYDSGGILSIETQRWHPMTALRSVVEWVDRYDVIDYASTGWPGIDAMLRGIAPSQMSDVDVHGKNLMEAMALILNPLGFGFALEPWAQDNGKHRLIVFSLAKPQAFHRPNLGPKTPTGVTTAVGKTAVVQSLNFARDSGNVSNRVIIHGDRKLVQVALDFGGGLSSDLWDLKPFWDTADHDIATNWYRDGKFPSQLKGVKVGMSSFFDRFHPSGDEFGLYPHVYRTFVWNEDGHASQFGWSIPTMGHYVMGDLATGYSSRSRRPMLPSLTFTHGVREPASVWIAVADGQHNIDSDSWQRISASHDRTRCGFTLSNAVLATEKGVMPWRPWSGDGKPGTGSGKGYTNLTFLELLHNAITAQGDYFLVIRYVGTVAADSVLEADAMSVAVAGGSSRWPIISTRLVSRGNAQYEWKVVFQDHIWAANPKDTANDHLEAFPAAASLVLASGAEIGHGSILLRHLSWQYELGVGIPATSGRVIPLDLDASVPSPRVPIVIGVTWTFTENANKTELVLDSPMLEVT